MMLNNTRGEGKSMNRTKLLQLMVALAFAVVFVSRIYNSSLPVETFREEIPTPVEEKATAKIPQTPAKEVKVQALTESSELSQITNCGEINVCRKYLNVGKVHEQNRCMLGGIKQWITQEDRRRGVFGYGVPDYIMPLLTKDVGETINLSDLTSYLSTRVGNRPNYMEIGVSVGKNLLQVLSISCDANVVAFDIEKINPTFKQLLAPYLKAKGPDELMEGHEYHQRGYVSPKKDKCGVNSFKGSYRGNTLHYLHCDEFDNVGWRGMKQLVSSFPSKALQVIFSDAMHTAEAINFELDRVFEHELLDKENFAYIWDDMNWGDMGLSIKPFCDRIVNYASPSVRDRITCVTGVVPGWCGVNETPYHTIVVITTVEISEMIESIAQPILIRKRSI
jgi:hypothetical protein